MTTKEFQCFRKLLKEAYLMVNLKEQDLKFNYRQLKLLQKDIVETLNDQDRGIAVNSLRDHLKKTKESNLPYSYTLGIYCRYCVEKESEWCKTERWDELLANFEPKIGESPKQTMKKIFICHANEDKNVAIEFYDKFIEEGFQPWLDKKSLLPGQNWQVEIPKEIKNTDYVLVLFSSNSVNKRGYVQKEYNLALDTLNEIPEGNIYVIPVKIDQCITPTKFEHLHWVNLFEEGAFEKILQSIKLTLH